MSWGRQGSKECGGSSISARGLRSPLRNIPKFPLSPHHLPFTRTAFGSPAAHGSYVIPSGIREKLREARTQSFHVVLENERRNENRRRRLFLLHRRCAMDRSQADLHYYELTDLQCLTATFTGDSGRCPCGPWFTATCHPSLVFHRRSKTVFVLPRWCSNITNSGRIRDPL